ncbi:unnamed protein product [Calypogeia fissa]
MSASAIVKAHFDEVFARWRKDNPDEDADVIFSRDMQLTPKDVWTVRESMWRRQPDYVTDDAAGVKLWTLQNDDDILLYQPQIKSINQPFVLLCSSPWQRKRLTTLGHNGPLALDATFGTNVYGFPFYTIVDFDQFQNAIPVAWALMQRYKTKEVVQVLIAVAEAANAKRTQMKLEGEWKPNCWIIDVADEEQGAIR